jgi:Bacterial Ig-like domain
MKFNRANIIQGSVFLLALSATLLTACGGGGGAVAVITIPAVNSAFPLVGASGVAVTATISATFNEAMNASSVNVTNFTLSDGTTNVTGEVSYDSASHTATFIPKSQLNYLKTYTATIATGITDEASNALKNNYIWSFTTLQTPFSIANLPNPILVFDRMDTYSVSGVAYDRYRFTVYNWSDYPTEMFAARTDLPACGSNNSASRTWVDVHDASTQSYIYGFCAFYSPEDLNLIWFSVPTGTTPPSVYITLTDRLTPTVYTSNTVNLVAPE